MTNEKPTMLSWLIECPSRLGHALKDEVMIPGLRGVKGIKV